MKKIGRKDTSELALFFNPPIRLHQGSMASLINGGNI